MRGQVLLAAGALAAAFLLVRERRRRSPEALVRRYFEAWEEGAADALQDVVDPGYSGHLTALAGTEERDRDTLAEQIEAHARVFEDPQFDIEDIVASGDEVAARVHMRASHAETHHTAEMDGFVFFRVERGRIAEEWSSWDYLGLARQLGVDGASDS